jgi:hypothetical protein
MASNVLKKIWHYYFKLHCHKINMGDFVLKAKFDDFCSQNYELVTYSNSQQQPLTNFKNHNIKGCPPKPPPDTFKGASYLLYMV